ncbi:MAG: B12-binding domain-containing radical SAM protein [Nanoarchaeota archaeon]|nr:B12-binding domain-containing radical SAM protein [Nanoarchaeota archaeon]
MENQKIKKILLVYPNSPTHYVVPPIGLGYLATALRKGGFEAGILDGIKEKLNLEKLEGKIKEWKPDVIGIQVFSCDAHTVKEYVSKIRDIDRNILIIIGGAHVSGVGKEVFDYFRGIHFAIAGEAETAFPLLLKTLGNRVSGGAENPAGFSCEINSGEKDLDMVPGLIWKRGEHIIANAQKFEEDLDALGFPAWDLMDPRTYPQAPQGAVFRNWPIAPILTSRGCPYRCTYCAGHLTTGYNIRFRSIEKVLEEIEMLYRDYGVREIHIIDDNFTFKRERAIKFCNEVAERGLNISLTFPNGVRLDTLDEELLRLLKKAGCYSITLGIESGSQKILNDMKKSLNLKTVEEKVALINKVGIDIMAFFIVGYPTETRETILETIEFAKHLKIKRAHFSTFLPLPNTEASRMLLRDGVIREINYDTLFYTKAPMPPKGMTSGELKALQRKAFLEFYMRPHIMAGMIKEVRSPAHLKMLAKRAWDYAFKR